jgi:hypothetical protein
MNRVRLLTLLLAAAAQGLPLLAQSGANTGLRGVVTDGTGAVLPSVKITILRVDTGEKREVLTSGVGDWEARFLAPGPYQLVFERTGFKKLTREGVEVSTSEIATVNIQMEVGDVGQSVEVTANAQMVSSSSATVVRTLDRRELEDLPTSSRNFTQLLVIEPGVSADISELLSNDNASISPSVNGARTTNNSFVFNGVDVTSLLCCNSRINGGRGTIDEGGGTLSRNIAPALETLEEVKLQTSLFDAATGRNGGGNFQLVSKSGNNDLHGSVYSFFQNDKLIANDFFFNRAGLERPILRRNEGGGTLGGPIVRNRTFFFGSYQFTRARTSFVDEATNTRRVPSALTDDRSDAGIDNFARALWPSNAGPVTLSAINPISRALLKAKFPDGTYLVPSGNSGLDCRRSGTQPVETCSVVSVIPATFDQDQFSVNLDHQVTQSNKLSGKFFFTNQPSIDPLANGNALTRHERNEQTDQRTFSLTDVHIVSPTIINEFRTGFFRNRNNSEATYYFTNAEFGIATPISPEEVPDLSQINIAAGSGATAAGDAVRFGSLADGTRIFDLQNTYTFADTVSLSRGKHSIRFGGEIRRHALDGDLREGRNRRHNLRSWFDFLTVGFRNPGDANRARQISDSSLNYGETVRNFRMSDWNWFIADDWKITPNLTLNVGVRHEIFGFPYEKNGFLVSYDYPAALATGLVQDGFLFASNFDESSVPGGSGLGLKKAGSKSIIPNDYNNIMPRFGFAWAPLGGSRFVVRGGYGMFYERITAGFANSLRQSPPFFRELQLNNLDNWNTFPRDIGSLPIPAFRVGFDDGEPILVASTDPSTEFEAFETQMIPSGLATPYTQQWSLNTQWEFRPNLLAEIGYVGTKGTKLLQAVNANAPVDIDAIGGFLPRAGVPGGGFTGNYFLIDDDNFVNTKTPTCDLTDDPGECTIPGELRGRLLGLDEDEGANMIQSNSNSIYHSLQASLTKRYSRGVMFNLNYTFSRAIDVYSDEGKYQVEHDQTRPFLNRGLSDFHRKHRFIFSGTWDLPLRGSRWLTGWQISGVGTFQSGRPFSIIDGDFSGFLYSSTGPRPNIRPGATHADLTTEGPVTDRITTYFNRSALQSSGAQFGNLGRNVVMGPDQRRLDLSVIKRTRLTERTSLEFRAEGYNIANNPTFRNPDRDMSNASFGSITRTRGGPRVIQLGLKLRF